MMHLQRAGSAESSSTESKNKSKVRVWLSLSPPKSYQCSLCSRSFRSVQALGGHQNAHRKEKNAMHKMYMDILRSLKQEEEPLVHSPMPLPIPPLPHHQLMPPTVTVEPEIDLELGLSCGPSSPKLKYYEFMPMKG